MSDGPSIDGWERTPADVAAMLTRGDDFLLLDCREDEEVAIAAIDGAMHVPMGEVPSRLPELEEWADRPVVVYCHRGVRSLNVAAYLRNHDFDEVHSMAGGIDRWSVEIDAEVKRY